MNQNDVVEVLKAEYPVVEFESREDDIHARTIIKLIVKWPSGNLFTEHRVNIDHAGIAREAWIFVTEEIERGIVKLLESLPENIFGDYPPIRLWADVHLGQPTLFGEPNREIPEWVYPKYRRSTGRVHKKSEKPIIPPKQLEETEIGDDGIQRREKVFSKEQIEEVKMATKKRKVRVPTQKNPRINPKRVKRPHCPVHTMTEMKFNEIRMVWECTEPNCSLIARPKQDSDDKALVLGTGNIQLRMVAHDGQVDLVLLSDDNVALNITPYVDIGDVVTNYDVVSLAQSASDTGKDAFFVPLKKIVEMKMQLHVQGAEEIAEMEF
jgi:hypothetical protein